MTAAIPRAWFPCCSHCVPPCYDAWPGHPVPCLVCQTESPSLFDEATS